MDVDLFTRDDLKSLLAKHESPCVSIYIPTHRGGAQEDPIRWRNNLAQAEESLVKAAWPGPAVKDLLAPARRLQEESLFWKNQSDGLAVFLAPHFFKAYRLPLAFRETTAVANRFSVAPLLPLLSGNGKFFILALSQHSTRLLHGSRYTVSEIDLRGVPQNLGEALLGHDPHRPSTFFGRRGDRADGWGGIFHGHGVGLDDPKNELLQYFHKIDRGLHELLREEKAPLVLAAVEYLQPIYRQANTYPHLQEKGIEGNTERLSSRELHERAWPLVKPIFEAAQQKATAQYQQIAGTEHASADMETVVAAANAGRVESLFVANGRQVWGVLDPATAKVEKHDQAIFGDVDLLDLAAAWTLEHGHTIYCLDPSSMPSKTDVAAIFCMPLPKHGKRP
jgi:Bacterial archaeo-eukaryotic release factor family 7